MISGTNTRILKEWSDVYIKYGCNTLSLSLVTRDHIEQFLHRSFSRNNLGLGEFDHADVGQQVPSGPELNCDEDDYPTGEEVGQLGSEAGRENYENF